MLLNSKLVDLWAAHLSQKLGRRQDDIRVNGLSASDFRSSGIQIEFGDGSNCTFKYSICVVDREKQAVAVFTEHCGYHEFSICGAAVWEIGDRRTLLLDDR